MDTLDSRLQEVLASPKGRRLFALGAGAAAVVGAAAVHTWLGRRQRLAALRKSTVLITGASQGIGAELARQLARLGATVLLLARSADALEALAAEINAAAGRRVAFAYAVDCASITAVDEVAARITEAHGCPDVVVNNAGAGRWLALWETVPSDVAAALDAPLLAAANVSRAFLPAMLARRSGTILMVQSPASRTPFPGSTMYSVSRWGLRGLAAALRADVHGTPLRVQEAILAETTSSYFVNNPGSAQRIPSISGLLGRLTPATAAAGVVDTLVSGRDEVSTPLLLAATTEAYEWAPRLVQAIVNATGWSVEAEGSGGASSEK
jgi:short-subunit dehydrogenase